MSSASSRPQQLILEADLLQTGSLPLLPSPGGVPRPTTLAISTDLRKLPPSFQVVPPATADPQIDLHRSGLISFLFSSLA